MKRRSVLKSTLLALVIGSIPAVMNVPIIPVASRRAGRTGFLALLFLSAITDITRGSDTSAFPVKGGIPS